ncbi:hypothetical protein GS624_01170 [Ruegeria sp. HKCCD5849]|uniref:hypothetical protein n=1 Tax=unclassified Ruegeria TaxID=2625375 RepID=UPI001492E93A|nr:MULTISPECIES: hypothetical protein [unclassified Ruegeria]NOD45915.1 hypothetical protein [Ruegeria sp. HKCCD5849]NOD50785.1 hypothetical protein [Ruegeria sp. HKCCD5851]
MSNKAKLDYRPLWKVEEEIWKSVKRAFDDAPCKDWSTDEQGHSPVDFIEKTQRGVLFYCMEDLLWPNGRKNPPNREVFWGTMLSKDRYIRCGEKGTLGLNQALKSRRHPGKQPIALRTYRDALKYHQAGSIAADLFPFVNKRWSVRQFPSNSSGFVETLLKPVQNRKLYIYGKSASRIAAAFEPEIRYVVGTKMVRDQERDMLDAPSKSYEHAFRRQLDKLYNEWLNNPPSNARHPTDKWIRERLGVWEVDNPELEGGLADNHVVRNYKNAFKERVLQRLRDRT